jgi:hypothetical protein
MEKPAAVFRTRHFRKQNQRPPIQSTRPKSAAGRRPGSAPGGFHKDIAMALIEIDGHWIGLRENLQETMVFTIKYRVFL